MVVSHDAFSYLSKYGLRFESIAGLSARRRADAGRPRPAAVAHREEDITTVFGERLAPPELVDTLARDAGVTTEVLDPIEGLTDETEGEDYLTLMAQNLDVLRNANGCP